jgi:hypothetical protein
MLPWKSGLNTATKRIPESDDLFSRSVTNLFKMMRKLKEFLQVCYHFENTVH